MENVSKGGLKEFGILILEFRRRWK